MAALPPPWPPAAASESLLHVAPMLAVTDRHYRHLCRLLSARAVLWTEMVHADAVTHAAASVLPFDHGGPAVLQLGGSCPAALASAARAGADAGYGEVNLNCGCPSGKAVAKADASRCFGAALMKQPALAGECLRRMSESAGVPVSVKCRLGVDDAAEYEDLARFVAAATEEEGGASHVVVHCRAALLGGLGGASSRGGRRAAGGGHGKPALSPAANRSVPPLRPALVYRLKADYPRLRVTLNGGVASLDDALGHLEGGKVDGVMLGRALQRNPLLLGAVDERLHGAPPRPPGFEAAALRAYRSYVERAAAAAAEGGGGAAAAVRVRSKAGRHLGIAAVARVLRVMEAEEDVAFVPGVNEEGVGVAID